MVNVHASVLPIMRRFAMHSNQSAQTIPARPLVFTGHIWMKICPTRASSHTNTSAAGAIAVRQQPKT